jgi:YtxH-like protein
MADINVETILGKLGLERQGSSSVLAPVVGAFIVGGIIGAGVALLFAPKAGEELRRDLGQRADEALGAKDDLVSEYKRPAQNEPRPSASRPPQTGAPTARPSGS